MIGPESDSTAGSETADGRFAELLETFVDVVASNDDQKVLDFLELHPKDEARLRRLLPMMSAMAAMPNDAEPSRTAPAAGANPAEDVESETPAALAEGDILGDFRVLREIARGGMGIVYEAEQISISRKVALKILPVAAVMDPRHVRRFRIEVQAAALLQHQNIVPVYSVGCEHGIHYYAMQYVNGHTLAELIATIRDSLKIEAVVANDDGSSRQDDITATASRTIPASPAADDMHVKHGNVGRLTKTPGGIPEVENAVAASLSDPRTSNIRDRCRAAATLIAQASDALDHAHERGVQHRDIKPSNLMVDTTGKLWITDFGLARLEADAGTTVTGQIVGTLRYMSPEQALAKRAVIDHRADVYSVGATLYELCVLRPAYVAADRQELLKQIAFEKPVPLRRIEPTIPRELETITSKAMEKDPVDRYETAQQLAEDLRRFLDDRPILATPPSVAEKVRKWSLRHRGAVFAVTAAALFFLLASLAALSFHSNRLSEANRSLETLNAALVRSYDATRELLYLTDMRLAFQEWDNRRIDDLRRILDRHRPRQDERDVRGREWHLLAAMARPLRPTVFVGHEGPVREIAMVPGTDEFVSVGDDGTIRHWSISQRSMLRTMASGSEQLHAVAISPDGKWLATGNPTLELWDFTKGEKVRELSSNNVTLESIAFAPDGNSVAAAWRYDEVRVVTLDGTTRGTLPPTQLRNETLVFSRDGSKLSVPYLRGEDNLIMQWPIDSGNEPAGLGKGGLTWNRIAVSHDDMITAVVTGGGHLRFIENATDRIVGVLGGSPEDIRTVEFAPNDDRIVWGSDDGMLHVAVMRRAWQFGPTPALRRTVTRTISAHNRKITDVEYLPQDRVLTCSEDGSIKLWSVLNTHASLRMKPLGTSANSAAFSPDSSRIAAACGDGCIRVADAVDGRVLDVVNIGDHSLEEFAFYPDGSRIVVGDDHGRITIWQSSERRVVAEWSTPRPARIWAIAVAPNGGRVASAAADQLMRIHDAESLSVVHTISAPANVIAVDFSRDGRSLVYGGDFNEMYVCETSAWTQSFRIPTRSETLCVAFANKQQLLASGHSNGFVQIMDARNGHVLHRGLSSASVRSLAWSPDDRSLISTHKDGTLRVWHVATGTELGILHRGGMMFGTTRFSPDGRRLATVFTHDNASQGIIWKLRD